MAIEHWKASGLDLTPILHVPERPFGDELHQTKVQDHGIERARPAADLGGAGGHRHQHPDPARVPPSAT
ncbi:MAG: hypothetical protein R2711_02925 [Acidimicrobiales bacterium]